MTFSFARFLPALAIALSGILAPSDSHAFGSGSSWGTQYGKYDPSKLPPEPSCVIKVKETIRVKGTLDGKGCLYLWDGKGKDACHSQKEVSETAPRMFVMEPGSTLRNLQMMCSPDGTLMNDDTTIDNVIDRDCGEDCVTTKGRNNVIKNSKFFFCDDKCIQLNQAEPVTIRDNVFTSGKIPLSGSGAKQGGANRIRVEGNRFVDCKTVILAQRDHDFHVQDNQAERIECFFETKEQGIIYDLGGNSGGELMCNRGSRNVKKEY